MVSALPGIGKYGSRYSAAWMADWAAVLALLSAANEAEAEVRFTLAAQQPP